MGSSRSACAAVSILGSAERAAWKRWESALAASQPKSAPAARLKQASLRVPLSIEVSLLCNRRSGNEVNLEKWRSQLGRTIPDFAIVPSSLLPRSLLCGAPSRLAARAAGAPASCLPAPSGASDDVVLGDPCGLSFERTAAPRHETAAESHA